MPLANRVFDILVCDDVRFEERQKISLMGLYTGHIHFLSFPVTMARLSVVVLSSWSPTEPVRSMAIKIVGPGLEDVREEISAEVLAGFPPDRDLNLVFANLVTELRAPRFTGPGDMRITVEVNGEEVSKFLLPVRLTRRS